MTQALHPQERNRAEDSDSELQTIANRRTHPAIEGAPLKSAGALRAAQRFTRGQGSNDSGVRMNQGFADAGCYQIRFQSLFQEGRALSFPCDSHGDVDLNALTPRAMTNYLFARAMVGREFAMPALLDPVEQH